MFKWLLPLLLLPSLLFAQTCPTRPLGTADNSCASTAFVANSLAAFSASITVGTTTISGGVSGQVLFDNAGKVGEYTNTQLTTLCNVFTSSLSGCVSGSGGGTTNFLRADGTWAAPGGSSGLTVGTTTITSGTSGRILFDNAGVLGERVPSGTGTTVATTTGTLTSGDCVKIDASGNLVDFGAACSSVSSGTLVSIVVYSGSQTITIPATATKGFVRMWGGSGGSGGSGANGSGSAAASAGGGAGGYLEKYLTGLTSGNTVAYTQGAAGAAGSAAPGNGGNGGASSLASGTQTITTLTANGGSGSALVSSVTAQRAFSGGAGGTATNGDYNLTGAAGGQSYAEGDGATLSIISIGNGGPSLFSPGANGVGTIGGGAGNAGVSGGLIIMWFTWNLPANDNFLLEAVA